MTTVKVQLARPWTDPDKEQHKADSVVEVAPEVAEDLLFKGYARTPDTDSKKKG